MVTLTEIGTVIEDQCLGTQTDNHLSNTQRISLLLKKMLFSVVAKSNRTSMMLKEKLYMSVTMTTWISSHVKD